jgi:hypothetical protein
VAEFGERGFEVLMFEDPVAFRYAYETGYRSKWERGESTSLVAVVPGGSADLEVLPYDVFHAGRKLSFSLSEQFPNLSYPVVSELSGVGLDLLYEELAETIVNGHPAPFVSSRKRRKSAAARSKSSYRPSRAHAGFATLPPAPKAMAPALR